MSGTMTKKQVENLPKKLGFKNIKIICISPDKENIFLEKKEKIVSKDVTSVYEHIFKTECLELQKHPTSYPVTLLFIPMYYMSCALFFLKSLFGENKIMESCYSAIFANQDDEVIQATLKDLNTENPRIRLILTTSVTGMGFDPTCITRVIHASPPRSVSQYLQEIGRAGRRGQASEAILYYNKRDIAKNLPGISDDIISYCNTESCLRTNLLSVFGYLKSSSLQGCACCCFCKKTCTCENCELASVNI
ncbi:recQ [Mytilus edulis]|uniref:DNA 3'-5' helicase n=1 Tax=Mytilus edulis TaxID=6550 RepID=A0A8S3S5K0_MYTED|nr:recQ [Mytilus edulis]